MGAISRCSRYFIHVRACSPRALSGESLLLAHVFHSQSKVTERPLALYHVFARMANAWRVSTRKLRVVEEQGDASYAQLLEDCAD